MKKATQPLFWFQMPGIIFSENKLRFCFALAIFVGKLGALERSKKIYGIRKLSIILYGAARDIEEILACRDPRAGKTGRSEIFAPSVFPILPKN